MSVKPPAFHVYKRDVTKFWDEDVVARAGEIFDVYIYNPDYAIRICEFTPSHELWYVGPTWDGNEEWSEKHKDDEDARQKLFEDILFGSADTEEVIYVHVQNIDDPNPEKFTITEKVWEDYLRGADGDEEVAEQMAREMIMEYMRGNGYIY